MELNPDKKGLFNIGSMFNIGSKLLVTRFNLIGILTAFYLGSQYHEPVARVEENLLNKNVQIEDSYFADPSGLQVYKPINENGLREVYLQHTESETKVKIGKDMLPENSYILESLEKRVDEMNPKEAKDFIKGIHKLQGIIYGRF